MVAINLSQYANGAAEALERLRSSTDIASLGLSAALERLTQRIQPLIALANAGAGASVSGGANPAPSAPAPPLGAGGLGAGGLGAGGLGAGGLAASLPLALINPTPMPPPLPAGSRTPSIATPPLAALSPATVTTPTIKGVTAGPSSMQGGGFPLPLPVRVVAMEARASAQMAVLALPGQAAAVAKQQVQTGGGGIAEFARNAGAQGTSLFAQLKDAMTGFASAADPFVAWPTYKASVEGLSISIGQMFTPALMEVSGYIQQATAFLDGMDANTKTAIGRWIAFGAAGLGAAAVLLKLGSAFITVANQARMAAIWMATTPTGLIVSAAAAVAGLAAAWYLTSQNARSAAGAAADASKINPFQGGAQAQKPTAKELDALTPDARAALAEAERTRSILDVEKARAEVAKSVEQARKEFNAVAAGAKPIPEDQQKTVALNLHNQIRSALEGPAQEEGNFARAVRANPALLRGEIPANSGLSDQAIEVLKKKPGTPADASRLLLLRQQERLQEFIEAQVASLPEGPQRDAARAALMEGSKEPTIERRLAALRKTDTETLILQAFRLPLTERMTAARAKLEANERVASYAQAQGAPTGPMQALGNLPAPVISSTEALADRLQIAALKGDDLQAANMAKQLQALEQSNVLLKEVKDAIRDLRVLPTWMY